MPWILQNGLHCANGSQDPDFVPIGDGQIIQQRRAIPVPIAPYGDLSDYVPFYFTPYSPMLLNIKTGYRGVTQRPNEEIAILVSSLDLAQKAGAQFVFTDRHAMAAASLARFSSDLEKLPDYVPWEWLQKRDFKRDSEWPEKFERYQAEALIYCHLPTSALKGVVCYSDEGVAKLEADVMNSGLSVKVLAMRNWYF